MVEVAAENKSTLVLPVPLDLLSPFIDFMKSKSGGEKQLPSSTGTPVPRPIPTTAPAELLAKK